MIYIKHRCSWVNLQNKKYIKYHDNEWGEIVHYDNELFELLILEGAQAGLSWETILNKRDNYRKAFDGFKPEFVSNYNDNKIAELLKNKGIIRNKRKVMSAIKNAKVFLEIQKEFKTFDKYIWSFVNFKQIKNTYKSSKEIPVSTELSSEISIDLKKRGMSFVGPVIMYSFMQSIGMVNDHEVSCFRYKEVNNNVHN